ncbi:MAG TPA: cellulase family glycosylhydrolase, partial [Verrucomicrobiae bacterium]
MTAADLPTSVLPDGVGVNIHFTKGHERDLDLIAAAGFRFVRMDFGWGSTERQKGEYDWSAYDALTADLEHRGLRAIYILDYSNPLYEATVAAKNPVTGQLEQKSTASPQHPESIAAFAQWAAAAAKHFHGHRILWEIWNEPNIGFWKPHPDARQYAELALATCRAVRAADPDSTIIAPASSSFPWEFMEVLFKAGALDYLDAVSVHPYRGGNQGPETAKADYDKLHALIDRYAPAARRGHIPIISGEWGYSTCVKGVSLDTQAA